MLSLILLWAVTAASIIGGWRAGGFKKSAVHIIAAACCLILVAGALASRNLSWLPEAWFCPIAVSLQYAWFTPPAAFLFSLGARQVEQQSGRNPKLLKVFIVLLAGFSTLRLADQQGWLLGNIGKSAPRIDHHGVVLQNSGSTCGAASCATLLRHLNIDSDATEAQMIPLCQTGMFGSTPLGMATGLKSIAGPKGWHVQLIQCDWETFQRSHRPAIITTKYGALANHAVAILDFNSGGVQVADPLSGLAWWSNDEFKRVFGGEAVVLSR